MGLGPTAPLRAVAEASWGAAPSGSPLEVRPGQGSDAPPAPKTRLQRLSNSTPSRRWKPAQHAGPRAPRSPQHLECAPVGCGWISPHILQGCPSASVAVEVMEEMSPLSRNPDRIPPLPPTAASAWTQPTSGTRRGPWRGSSEHPLYTCFLFFIYFY